MKHHIISIGGGFASTIELTREVIRKYGAANVTPVIACLAGESPDLWRLVAETERMHGISVQRITYQPYRKYIENAPPVMWWDIWDIFNQQGMMGNSLADPCSRMLKREVLKAWIQDNFNPSETVLHVGITRDEIDRQLAITRNWGKAGYAVEFDLCDIETTTSSSQRCFAALGWIPRVYAWGASHNNCGGFCVKAGHGQMARLLWHEPDLFYYHAEKERLFQLHHNVSSTIMRDIKTRGGKRTTTSLSMHDFALRMKARWGGMLPGFDPFEGLEEMAGCTWCDSVA